MLCASWGVVLTAPCPLCSVWCCAALCECVCVVLFVWSALVLAPGAVVRCCVLCCFPWCSVVRCSVGVPAVVFWRRVLVLVSLSGRVACFPVVGVVCCGALFPCVVFWGALLSCGAVPLCSAVRLRCCLCLLCLSSFNNRCKNRKIFCPEIKQNYMQPNTHASSKTRPYTRQFTCCRPLVMVCSPR